MSTAKLNGQIALVTGGDSGIGKGVALALAEAGAKVVVNYAHHAEAAEEVVKHITDAGGEAFSCKADVSQEAQVQAMFKEVFKQYGTIDILVNNAGLQKDAKFVDMTLDEWNTVIGINLTGQFLCAREAAKEFIRRGVDDTRSRAAGKIICMSSVHEVIPWGGHVNYASSKGGIMMLMKSMAQELAPHKIRVVAIGPGAIQTPINKEAWETPEALNKLLTLIPYNRIGQPEDIGKLAAWLASDDADYITGTTIFSDGGMTLYPGFADNG
ncbi:SDR family oxidoreductase [Mucilaginibacter sp. KACC 22063]|uniref:SDR family oxidoreductase n=1 Tax=Mucilaginibacter sp. KACC 22063 TaxID=3025666 RepID=UPI00236533C5|nr:SDR family oxidoreductase [Mucilaginibacter sp. KACC 22063]WDF53569.1 SDR family oxidoreductase [Mucilaginibacter sp. KACC 22063]